MLLFVQVCLIVYYSQFGHCFLLNVLYIIYNFAVVFALDPSTQGDSECRPLKEEGHGHMSAIFWHIIPLTDFCISLYFIKPMHNNKLVAT